MGKVNYAAIDIGSNAARLLIKSIDTEAAEPVFVKEQLLRVPIRLGEDTFSKGAISPEKSKALLRLIKSYKLLMKIYGVKRYRACATSAMRDASNGRDLVREIGRKTGILIEIIDGNEEARLIYDNHIEEMLDRDKNYIYVDVGGGSTEISLISEGELRSSRSYNIGTVRLLKGKVSAGTVTRLREDMRAFAREYHDLYIIGSGGNINKLYRLAPRADSPEGTLSVRSLALIGGILKGMSTEERIRAFGLRPDRADVITHAADIFMEVAENCGAHTILVPTIGLADGIVDSLFAEDCRAAER